MGAEGVGSGLEALGVHASFDLWGLPGKIGDIVQIVFLPLVWVGV